MRRDSDLLTHSDDDGCHSRRITVSQNRTQVMRVLNTIAHQEQRRQQTLPGLLKQSGQIGDRTAGKFSHEKRHALVMPAAAQGREPF